MAGITLAIAEAKLAEYLAAETKVNARQSYEIDGRKLTSANMAEIQRGIDTWNKRCIDLSAKAAGRSRARTIVAG